MATARRFAATLGIIAFVFVAGFGLWERSELDWVLLRALLALIMFTVLGFVAGLIGAAIARDSANAELRRKVAAEQMRQKRLEEERAAREGSIEESKASRRAGAAGATGDTTGPA